MRRDVLRFGVWRVHSFIYALGWMSIDQLSSTAFSLFLLSALSYILLFGARSSQSMLAMNTNVSRSEEREQAAAETRENMIHSAFAQLWRGARRGNMLDKETF